jgi:hypothetical protein
MAEKEKSKGIGLPQQKGTFGMRGIVTGVQKESFYKDSKTSTGKDSRTINFGIKVNNETETQFVTVYGFTQDYVYFSKNVKGEKSVTEKVAWKDRDSFRKEGFGLIGVSIGIEKTTTDGKETNDIKHMVPFDACKYLDEHLKDGMRVYVRGNIEFQSFTPKGGGDLQHSSRLVVTHIFLESDAAKVLSSFDQPIVIQEFTKEGDNLLVDAFVVNYKSIESVGFEIHTKKNGVVDADQVDLVKKIKGLVPYTAITVSGDIETVKNTDVVEEEDSDGWGEKSKLDRVVGQYKKIFVINGARPDTIDKEGYSEEKINEAFEKIKADAQAVGEYGGSDDWGGSKGAKPTEEESEAW